MSGRVKAKLDRLAEILRELPPERRAAFEKKYRLDKEGDDHAKEERDSDQ